MAFILFLILTLIYRSPVYAVDYFFEDFSNNSYDINWLYDPGNETYQNSWVVVEGRLLGSPTTKKSSTLYLRKSINNSLADVNVTMDIENKGGVDLPILLRVDEDKNSYYQVDVRFNEPSWHQDHNNITLRRKNNGTETLLSVFNGTDTGINEISQNKLHTLSITVIGNNIIVLFDDNQVINYFDTSDNWIQYGAFGLLNWGGDCQTKTQNYYDNIQITDLSVKPLRIILPGLGASWNSEAMLTGSTSPDLVWQMTPFVKNYDNLKKALEDNGLSPDTDYLVWNYDWRLPLGQTVERFDSFIDSKSSDGKTKVDIIGHSLGGLIGRLWAQKETDKGKIGKIITLGSPHLGAVEAFEAWNGAKFSDSDSIGYIALKVLLQLQRRKQLSETVALKNYAPIIKDLLPTFDYLRINGQTVSPAESRSEYLTVNNLSVSDIYNNLEAFGGKNTLTKRWIGLGPRDTYETVLGYWPSGKPNSYIWNQGDGTVLWMSSKFEDDSFVEVNSAHAFLPDNSINSVMAKLGLNPSEPLPMAEGFSQKAVFFMGSPAKIKVNCGFDDVVSNDFVVTSVNEDSDCRVEVLGTGSGTYHLVSGKVGLDSSWNYFEGEINEGELDVYTFNGSNLELEGQVSSLVKWWNQLASLLVEIRTKYPQYDFAKMNTGYDQRNGWDLTWELFRLRRLKEDEILTDKGLYLLKNILLSETTSEITKAQAAVVQASKDISLCDRETRLYRHSQDVFPTEFSARNYKLAEAAYKKAFGSLKKEQFKSAEVEARFASYFVKMVWN